MKPLTRRLIFTAIPLIIILSVIIVMAYLAYKAETEGVKLGQPKIYIDDTKVQDGQIQQRHRPKDRPAKNNGHQLDSHNQLDDLTTGPEAGRSDTDNTGTFLPLQKKTTGYGFSELEDTFMPSTRAFKSLKAHEIFSDPDKTKKEAAEFQIKLTGNLAKEMFIFGLYNSMKNGLLTREGGYLLKPKGKATGKKVFIEFSYSVDRPRNTLQLPVIFNGKVESETSDSSIYNIDKNGLFRVKKIESNPIDIVYSIERHDENSELLMNTPASPYLKKEFTHIPRTIKEFLDQANNSPEDIKAVFTAAALNKCFGYQKDIIPVKLAAGTTWGEYLDKYLSRNIRFMADCDVLSTYTFIFLRYLNIKCVIAVGYANTDTENISTLDQTKHHALLLAKINGKWLVFDPSTMVPDMSKEALALMKIKTPQPKAMPTKNISGQDRTIIQNKAAEVFEIPSEVTSILGGVITADETGSATVSYEPSEKPDIETLKKESGEIIDFYKEKLSIVGRSIIVPTAVLALLLFIVIPLNILTAWPVQIIVYLIKILLG